MCDAAATTFSKRLDSGDIKHSRGQSGMCHIADIQYELKPICHVWCCSGDIKYEPGAVVCRMAHSWVRFGSFQLPAALEENDLVKQLADYVIKHHYSHLQGAAL